MKIWESNLWRHVGTEENMLDKINAWIFNIYIQYLLKTFLHLKTNIIFLILAGLCNDQYNLLSKPGPQTNPGDVSCHSEFSSHLRPQLPLINFFKNKTHFIVMNPQIKISHRYTKVVTEQTFVQPQAVYISLNVQTDKTICFYFSGFAFHTFNTHVVTWPLSLAASPGTELASLSIL